MLTLILFLHVRSNYYHLKVCMRVSWRKKGEKQTNITAQQTFSLSLLNRSCGRTLLFRCSRMFHTWFPDRERTTPCSQSRTSFETCRTFWNEQTSTECREQCFLDVTLLGFKEEIVHGVQVNVEWRRGASEETCPLPRTSVSSRQTEWRASISPSQKSLVGQRLLSLFDIPLCSRSNLFHTPSNVCVT